MWVDVGANLTSESFRADLPEVLGRARAAGVDACVVTGSSLADSRAAADLAASEVGLWSTAGVHPHEARHYDARTEAGLRELLARPEVVAVGECGLDFNRNFSPPADQERAFAAQLELAADLQLPVFLHERDAHEPMADVLRRTRDTIPRAVVHCFTGTAEELSTYLDMDLHIGITGWICDERRGSHLRDVVKRIPIDRLMIETDSTVVLLLSSNEVHLFYSAARLLLRA